MINVNGGLEWNPEMVKAQMIDAMRVLARLPESGKHKVLKSCWPDDTYARSPDSIHLDQFIERRLVFSELGERELEERDRARLDRRPPPHPRDIARMNQALVWPMRYLPAGESKMMNLWASEVAKTSRSTNTARELGITKRWLNMRVSHASGVIASGLKRDRVLPL